MSSEYLNNKDFEKIIFDFQKSKREIERFLLIVNEQEDTIRRKEKLIEKIITNNKTTLTMFFILSPFLMTQFSITLITGRCIFVHKQPFTGFFPMLNIIIALFVFFKREKYPASIITD